MINPDDNTTLARFQRWLHKTKTDLFTRRGRSGIDLGRRMEALGVPEDDLELVESSARVAALVPRDSVSDFGQPWLRKFLREADRWRSEASTVRIRLTPQRLADHVLRGGSVRDLLRPGKE